MILTLHEAIRWRKAICPHRVVATNGCFDLLHAGHARFLEKARWLGDKSNKLIVGVNSDRSIRSLKGEGRPICSVIERTMLLDALWFVDMVVVFDEDNAAEFLRAIDPDVWVKGGDYTLDTINQDERAAVRGEISFVPFLPGISTTRIIERIRNPRPIESKSR